VEAIAKKCQVLSYEEYEQTEPGQNVYFSRSQFDKKDQQLQPPIEKWPRSCICLKPLNPDKPYIFCDACKEWYHMECMRITQQEADVQDEYTCLKCQKAQIE
jgi:hypothetical protein